MSAESKRILPGDITSEERIGQIIRVNHAGEYGALRIYAGQLAVLKGKESEATIREMAEQEKAHLKAFEQWMVERRARPTLLLPLWHVGGYALGAVTALMGKEAAMACTVAVESVIDEHYAGQEKELGEEEAKLKSDITQFRADEMHHHDTGLKEGAENAPGYAMLTAAIRQVTRTAIWLSTRI